MIKYVLTELSFNEEYMKHLNVPLPKGIRCECQTKKLDRTMYFVFKPDAYPHLWAEELQLLKIWSVDQYRGMDIISEIIFSFFYTCIFIAIYLFSTISFGTFMGDEINDQRKQVNNWQPKYRFAATIF